VLSTDKVLDPGSYCVVCVATVAATGGATGVACRRRGGVPSDEDADDESNESSSDEAGHVPGIEAI
jgi:hypothetical protein